MHLSDKRIKITAFGVFLAALLLFSANSSLYMTKGKNYFFSLFKNQEPDSPPVERSFKLKPRIHPEMQLHLKQVFESLNGSPAVETDGEYVDRRDFDNAINDVKTAENEEDRAYAVTLIGLSNRKEAIPAIIKALDDPSPLVRQETLERIFGWPEGKRRDEMIIAALKSKDPDMIYAALESIYETGNKALLRQIKRLRKHKDPDIAKLASEVYKNLTE
jgi:hypothetical protein